MIKALSIFFMGLMISFVAGCGGHRQNPIPNLSGSWNLMLTPHAPGSSASLPGASLVINFTQNSSVLSGAATNLVNQAQTCIQDLSGAGNLMISGKVFPPGTGDVPPLNLLLTITFVPAGASSSTSINITSFFTDGTQSVNGIYQIPGVVPDCVEGTFTLTRLGSA